MQRVEVATFWATSGEREREKGREGWGGDTDGAELVPSIGEGRSDGVA